jgi:7-cyano-7-deazaguanine synthase
LDYGQAARGPEATSAAFVAHHFNIPLTSLTLNSEAMFGAGEIQGRNAFLIFAALMCAPPKPGLIALGIHADSPYYDCSPRFLEQINQLVATCSEGRVRVVAPLLSWTKADILKYCMTVGIPLDGTYSCEQGAVPPCGRCLSCRDRHAQSIR